MVYRHSEHSSNIAKGFPLFWIGLRYSANVYSLFWGQLAFQFALVIVFWVLGLGSSVSDSFPVCLFIIWFKQIGFLLGSLLVFMDEIPEPAGLGGLYTVSL